MSIVAKTITGSSNTVDIKAKADRARKQIIEEYKASQEKAETLSNVTLTPSIARISDGAKGKPRIGELKNLLDRARVIYRDLEYGDFRYMSEEFWEDQIMLLASMNPHLHMVNQYGVEDRTSNAGSSAVRFFDFVQFTPDFIRVFELKNHKITDDDVYTTIHNGVFSKGTENIRCKGYPDVIKAEWPNKEVRLIFTSPHGIYPEALNRIEDLNSTDLGISVRYVNFRDLCRKIFESTLASYPNLADWYYERVKFERFRFLF